MTTLGNSPDDRAFQPEILAVFETVSGLEPKVCEQIAGVIEALADGGSEPAVHEIARLLGDSDAATMEAVHIINAATNTPAANVGFIVRKFQNWVDADPDRALLFDSARMGNLQTNLQTLTRDSSAIALMKKANRIMRSIGNEPIRMQIVCDARPVFDRKRERIESILTLANLKIVYQTQVGDPESFELALTRGELVQLGELVDDALSKLDLMEELRKPFNAARGRADRGES